MQEKYGDDGACGEQGGVAKFGSGSGVGKEDCSFAGEVGGGTNDVGSDADGIVRCNGTRRKCFQHTRNSEIPGTALQSKGARATADNAATFVWVR